MLSPFRPIVHVCANDLFPGATLPSSRMYNLTRAEQEAMESYIGEVSGIRLDLALFLSGWGRILLCSKEGWFAAPPALIPRL